MIDNTESSDNEDKQDELICLLDGHQIQQRLRDPLISRNHIHHSNIGYVWRCISSSDPYPDRSPEVELALAITSTYQDIYI